MEALARFVDYVVYLPVPCLIGLMYGMAFLFVPIAQAIEYRRDCKKFGKEYADELWRRWR